MAPPKKNPYAFYVEERCRATGKSIPEGFGLFGSEWERLNAAGKQKYFQMADQYKSRTVTKGAASAGGQVPYFSGSFPEPVDSSGSVDLFNFAPATRKMSDIIMEVSHGVAEVVMDENSPTSQDIPTPAYDELLNDIVQTVENEYNDANDILLNEVFVISCVPLVLKDNNLKEVNRPIEIAVENFKLGVGYIGSSFHEFIDPGTLPAGWHFWVTDSRKKYHKIPAGSYVKSDEDCRAFHKSHKLNKSYYDIYAKLVRLAEKSPHGHLYPLFTATSDIGVISACLQWLRMKANEEGRHTSRSKLPEFKLSTLEEYCVNILSKQGMNPRNEMTTLKNTLGTKRYHHEPTLRCEFHQEVDSEICATGTAKDKIFLTFDYLRGILDLPSQGAYIPQLKY